MSPQIAGFFYTACEQGKARGVIKTNDGTHKLVIVEIVDPADMDGEHFQNWKEGSLKAVVVTKEIGDAAVQDQDSGDQTT
jgi:hypothetical protein